jgi:hypothetical protein
VTTKDSSTGYLSRAGFHGEHVFRGFSCAPAVIRTTLEQSDFTFADTLEQDFLESIFRGFLGAPTVIRTTLEHIPENLFLH